MLPGLLATAPAPLAFAPELHVRAFVLERAAGNVLIYSAPEAGPGTFEGVPIARAYLNHSHEARFGAELPGVPLFVHEADRAATARSRRVRAAFRARHVFGEDLEVIPIPGHTPGATAYLWDDGRRRSLFTGDTLYLRDGEWVAGLLASSDRAALARSLELIASLDFDVLVPWAASAGHPPYALTDRGDTRRRIEALLAEIG